MVSENKGIPFVDLFFFVLQEVISVNFTGLWKPTLYNLVIISRFFKWWRTSPSLCNVISTAYSFYPNGLAEWNTLKTVLRMATTGWKVLMSVCGFRVIISCHAATKKNPIENREQVRRSNTRGDQIKKKTDRK
jgi:hypothetical protein